MNGQVEHSRKRSRKEALPDEEDTLSSDLESGLGYSSTQKRQKDSDLDANGVFEPHVLILHQVNCSQKQFASEDHSRHDKAAWYRDQPRLFSKDTKAHALRGKEKVADVDEFLERNEQYVVVVYREYDCVEYHEGLHGQFEKQVPENMEHSLFLRFRPWFYSLRGNMELAKPKSESATIISQDLIRGLDKIVNANTQFLGNWNELHNLEAPYDYFLHHRSTIFDSLRILSLDESQAINSLLHYIQSTYETEHQEAEHLFGTGIVAQKHFSKLFRAKEVVVRRVEGGTQAYQVKRLSSIQRHAIDLECSSWTFDGTFRERSETLTISWPGGETVPISTLSIYPLRLDTSDLTNRLEQRGRMFWSCRRKKLVTYLPRDASSFELHTTNPRYMIDLETHRYLHPDNYASSNDQQDGTEEISAQDENPSENTHFLLLLPPTILGYGFHDKKWRTLQVEHLSEVQWNTQAFDRLVLKSQKKELIQAVVTSHVEKNNAADIVDDKGNGLILLLHGPPGTGKTLTAESVAEVAQKPLYRITCGDIGTEAQAVEIYLESALYIGTVWGCVVLLDEADVFLEERTPTDLARNALVSVFLRVLEYYDGILILTSNRVGLFDEAFKSRMQMALYYPKLDEKGRKEIWRNFFKALAAAGVDCNHAELLDKVDNLAENALNGRQIRNVIKTARQYAKFCGRRLEFGHLERVIDVSKEFDDYLHKTRGYDDDQWAQEQRIRLSR